MRPPVRSFVKICAETLPFGEPVVEFGSRQVARQEHLANLRPFFPQKRYVGIDVQRGPGVDVLLDVTCAGLATASVGTALMLETLEHVEFPREAIEDVYRVLKPGGILLASSVMNFPLHNPPDYWRFSPQSFASLLQPFEAAFVSFAGLRYFPHTVIGIGFKGGLPAAMRSRCLPALEQLHNPPDYWRFSPQSFASLLQPFEAAFVSFAGLRYFPHTVIGIGFKGGLPAAMRSRCLPALEQWRGAWQHDIRALARLLAPPLLLEGYTWLRDRNARSDTIPPLTILRS
jgi:SAM-dependent methyltransferase